MSKKTSFEVDVTGSLDANLQRLKQVYNRLKTLPTIYSPNMKLDPTKLSGSYQLCNQGGHGYFYIGSAEFCQELINLLTKGKREFESKGQ